MTLYARALQKLRQEATDEFRRTAVGQMFGEVDRMRRRGTAGRAEMLRLSRQLQRFSSRRSVMQELERTGVGKLIGEVDRYARRGLKEAMLDELLGALGPVGSLIGMFLRPEGRPVANINRELRAASDLLRAFGYRVEAPTGAQPSADSIARSEVERSRRFLESLGFKVQPPEPQAEADFIPLPSRRRAEPQAPSGPQTVTVGGIQLRLQPNDPLLTGEWIPVTSSNVHSIAFIWNDARPAQGTLRIRFLEKRGGTTKAGPVYHYLDVHPALFQDFRRAASKGRWVWDHMRIRGTVSGHRYKYMLAMLSSSGYVPRQATRVGNEEWYIRRKVRSKTQTTRGGNVHLGQTHVSQLDDAFVKYWDDRRHGRPNRGGPNRGKPNRGR